MDTYEEIKRLISNEIDEIFNDKIMDDELVFENEDQKEAYRNELVKEYLAFVCKDLQSDNA